MLDRDEWYAGTDHVLGSALRQVVVLDSQSTPVADREVVDVVGGYRLSSQAELYGASQ